jgi:hypothetical protein
MLKRICRQSYQQFLHSIHGLPSDLWGKEFLSRHFPGVEDPDVSEETDVNVVTQRIEERYVQA